MHIVYWQNLYKGLYWHTSQVEVVEVEVADWAPTHIHMSEENGSKTHI
jgi:hypothetical protein